MPDVKTIAGGAPVASSTLVNTDQLTILGDGSIDHPLHAAGGGAVNGSGSVPHLARWTGASTLGDSQITDDGTDIIATAAGTLQGAGTSVILRTLDEETARLALEAGTASLTVTAAAALSVLSLTTFNAELAFLEPGVGSGGLSLQTGQATLLARDATDIKTQISVATGDGDGEIILGVTGNALQKMGAYGVPGIVRPDVTGSRGDGEALESLLEALDLLGWIHNNTTP